MAVIKSSKIFISIRHPHATCIINAQRKDTATFTTTTHTHRLLHHRSPSTHQCQLLHMCVCVGAALRKGTLHEPLRTALHREVRGQADCSLGHHSATYTADVLGCSFCAPTLSGSVFVVETASRVCHLSGVVPCLVWVRCLYWSFFYFITLLYSSIPQNTCKQLVGGLRSGLMSLVGGRLYKHKRIWDLK